MSGHVRDQLSAYLDRELAPAEDDAVVSHLRECEACRSHLEALTSVDRVARALPVDAPAGYFDTLPGRVRARLEAASAVRSADRDERERGPFPARARAVGPARSSRPTVRRPFGLPAWTWAVAAAVLLAVVTPLTVREQRMPSTTPPPLQAPRLAIPATPPMTVTGEDAAPAPAPVREAARRDDSWKARGQGIPGGAPQDLGRDAVGGHRANAEPKAAERGFSVAPPPPPVAAYRAEPPSSELELGAAAQSPAPQAPAATAPAPAASPAAAKRQRAPGLGGPYAQQQTEGQAQRQAPPGEAADRVAAGSTAEEVTAADTREGARDKQEAAPTTLAKSATEQDEQGYAAVGGITSRAPTADERAFSRLAAQTAKTVGTLRVRREAWRTFALDYPQSPRADEARVRVIEAGIAAWRLGRDPADLGQARMDAASYLDRPDAAQAARVRALLGSVEGS